MQEYVRELIEDEDLKTHGEKELNEAKTANEEFSACIYVSRSTQLALRSQILMLKVMHLDDPFDRLIRDLIALYERQIELHQNLIDMCGKFLSGPKPGVDYQTLGAKMPRFELN